MSKLFLCLILLLGLYHCETFEGAPVYEMILKGDEGLTEVNLNVPKGKDFALKFKGNPTTGFTWVLLNPEEVTGSLMGVNFDTDGFGSYVADANDRMLDGAGGNFYFRFKALKVSNEAKVLKFSYRRVWERNPKYTQDINVAITVS